MTKRSIIIDCDPGQDDAVALLLAFASRDVFEILGVTTVAGNVPLDMTYRNAQIIADLANINDVPILAGCDKPIRQSLITAEHVHGKTGIEGMEISTPKQKTYDQHGVDFIVQTLKAAKNKSVTLVPTGPLTNIGAALTRAPEIAEKIDQIVLMGGASFEGGNITPSAEFNIYVDPEAAAIILACGVPVIMHGLDVTHKVLCTKERLEPINALGSKVAADVYGMLTYFNRFDSEKYGSPGAPLHDPCTIAYLLAPELFSVKYCNVEVEVNSELTRGHTAVDFWHVTDRPRNVEWVYDVDADGFFDLLTKKLALY